MNGQVQSLMLKGNSLYNSGYWSYLALLPALINKPKIKLLMLGLAGGTIAYQINRIFGNKVEMTILEVDEEVKDKYLEFLGQPIENAQIVFMDGLSYMLDLEKRESNVFDIIILDAYVGDKIPEVFFDYEFFHLSRILLVKGGILAINQLSDENKQIPEDLNRLTDQRFERYNILVEGEQRNNNIILGINDYKHNKPNISHNQYRNANNNFIFDAYDGAFNGK